MPRLSLRHLLFFVLAIGVVVCLGDTPSFAQNTSATDQGTPSALARGSHPLGSFGGSDVDAVNLFNGNLSLRIPVIGKDGRAGMGVSMLVAYNSKIWRMEETGLPDQRMVSNNPWDGQAVELLNGSGWTISAGRMKGRQSGYGSNGALCGTGLNQYRLWQYTLTAFTFTSPDGTEYEFRDTRTDGAFNQPGASNCGGMGNTDTSRGTKFVSVDGTSATFISEQIPDPTVYDLTTSTLTGQIAVAGTVFLRDGTRYGIAGNGNVIWQQDRNGNRIYFEYTGGRLTKITDTLGRTINIAYSTVPATVTGTFTVATITWTATGGTSRTITINGNAYQNVLRSGETRKSYQELFSGVVNTGNPHINVVEEIVLPSGHSWAFRYNAYAEVTHVATPTGGGIVYGTNTDSVTAFQTKRRITERKAYLTRTDPGSSNTNLASRTVYSDPFVAKDANGRINVTETFYEADGTTTESTVEHVFTGTPIDNYAPHYGVPANSGYKPWMEGKEYSTTVKNSAGIALRTVEYTWAQRAGWNGHAASDLDQPQVDPRLIQTRTILKDVASGQNNQFTDTVLAYDTYNNVTNEKVYDYGTIVGGTATRGALLRETQRTYVTSYTVYGPAGSQLIDYVGTTGSNDEIVHRRSLVLTEKVFKGATLETETDYEYDNYTAASDDYHDPMLVRSFVGMPPAVASSRNQNFNTDWERLARGNVTRITAGANDAANASVSHVKYDTCGNVIATIGPRTTLPIANNTVSVGYDPAYYYAYPTSSSRLVTQAGTSTTLTLTNYSVFDPNTGAVTSTRGYNDELTYYSYEDGTNELDRLETVTRPSGAGSTTIAYSGGGVYPLTVTETSTFSGSTDLWVRTEFDNLGRTSKVVRKDAGGDVTSETRYDARSRVYLSSNPYRAGDTTSTSYYGWTKTTYDALGRPLTVTTASDAAMTIGVTGTVSSLYEGKTTTVTDQTTRKRASVADGLGRLVSVTEAPGVANYGFVTSYGYDARGNLTSVVQGSQTRTFEYDMLSRLARATMPECNTITVSGKTASTHYKYDPASNLIERRDSRGIVTSYTFDEMNRALTTTYSGTTSDTPTPNVSYYYDTATIPAVTWDTTSRGSSKGRLVGVVTSAVTLGTVSVGQTAALYGYDLPGRLVRTGQLLDGQTYTSSVSLNAGGAATLVNYPSGTQLTPAYNTSGQLNSILRGTTGTNYLQQSATYTPAGGLATERLGTGNNLYHTVGYNSRLQPTTIGLGTATTGANQFSALKLEYRYGLLGSALTSGGAIDDTKNNGNVSRITITPGAGQNPMEQDYTYDPLNRIEAGAEYFTPTAVSHLTALTPPQGSPGAVVQVTISGTNLAGASAVSVTGTGVSAAIVGTPTSTSVTANVTITSGAATGPRQFSVTTPAGVSDNTLSFLVTVASSAHDTIGLYDPVQSYWYQRYANAPGPADNSFSFGAGNSGWLPITGDWNRDGMDTPGLYSPGSGVFLEDINGQGGATTVFTFGPANAGWKPIAGDWNGDGTDSIGLYDPASGAFYLKNVNSNGAADFVFTFGAAGAGYKPLAGDWNGDGVDTVGLYDPATGNVFLRNSNSNGAADVVLTFGLAGYIGFSGDWNNDGVDTIGAFNQATSTFYLRNSNTTGTADITVQFGGAGAGFLPIAGDWNGSAAKMGDGGGGSDSASKTDDVLLTQSWLETYAYDQYGNRTNGVHVDPLRNRIDAVGYIHDAPGNVTREPVASSYADYKYDAENHMWQAVVPNQSAATYVYDGLGRRVKKIVGSTVTKFVYGVSGGLIAEYDGAGVLQKEYVYGPSGLLATLEGAAVKYVTPDNLGSPRIITGQTANVISRHDYTPFGSEVHAGTGGRTGTGAQGYDGADGLRQQFTSKERDAETGMDYFGARYYRSGQGRWTTPDPYMPSAKVVEPQTWNRFNYVTNNPLRYVDPDGLDYVNLDGRQRELIDEWAKRQNKANGTSTSAQKLYDALSVSQRATYEQASHALKSTELVDRNGKSLGNALGLVKSVEFIAGDEKGKGSDEKFRVYVSLNENATTILASAKGIETGKNGVYHGDYDLSFRQVRDDKRGLQAGFQFSVTKDGSKADVDVDYQFGLAHLQASNSNVQAKNNYQRHIERWPGLVNWWDKKPSQPK